MLLSYIGDVLYYYGVKKSEDGGSDAVLSKENEVVESVEGYSLLKEHLCKFAF